MRPLALAAWALLGAASLRTRSAFADEPPAADPSLRTRAEQALSYGEIGDVEVLLGESGADVDREGVLVAGRFWRIGPRTGGDRPATRPASVSGRRIVWMGAWSALVAAGRSPTGPGAPPYPTPATGEVEPYPVLTPLVLDRLRRETVGASGLPDASPLAASSDPSVRWFVQYVYKPSILGPLRADWSEEERRSEADRDDRVRSLASRNRLLAVGSILAFLLAAVGFAALAGRRGRSCVDATREKALRDR